MLTDIAYMVILHAFCRLNDTEQNQLMDNHQRVKQFGSRSDTLFSLIWVQTVCKSYQQTALVGKKLIKQRVFVAEQTSLNKV